MSCASTAVMVVGMRDLEELRCRGELWITVLRTRHASDPVPVRRLYQSHGILPFRPIRQREGTRIVVLIPSFGEGAGRELRTDVARKLTRETVATAICSACG